MKIPILSTKLCIPGTQKQLVIRNRLFDKLNTGITKDLILVSAPAGFGKSTLISSWVNISRLNVAWLSLDKEDNQIDIFLYYLIKAFQKSNPTIGEEALSHITVENPSPPQVVLTCLMNDVNACQSDLFLVLEDLHAINDKSIHEAIKFLIDHCPSTLHIVITTRSAPLFPLARYRAAGRMIELRESDLRFLNEEISQFLNNEMGLDLDNSIITALEKRTEGWIAGLQMAAISMQNRNEVEQFIKEFSGSNRYIMDYLLEEVLYRLPKEIQHFLLTTSILNRFSIDLCKALLSIDNEQRNSNNDPTRNKNQTQEIDARSCVEYLLDNNTFLIALDEDRTWYRYHDLFSGMLRNRLQDTLPDRIHDLHLRAHTWFKNNGYILEAIHHLIAAEKFELAVELIDLYGFDQLEQNSPVIMKLALQLPPEIILLKPRVSLYITWHQIIAGQSIKIRPLLDKLMNSLSTCTQSEDEQWMLTIAYLARSFLDPYSSENQPISLPDVREIEKIPKEEKILRNIANYYYAMTLGRQGNLDDAIKISIHSIQKTKETVHSSRIPTIAPFLSRIYLIKGYLNKTDAICQEYLDPITQAKNQFIYTSGSMNIDRGEVFFERNQLDEAEHHIREGLKINKFWGNIMTDGFGLTALARVLRAQGKYTQALETVSEFERRMKHPSHPREFDEDLLTLRYNILLTSGNHDIPFKWADQIEHRIDYNRNKHFYRLTLASIRLAQGKFSVVEKLLADTIPPIGSRSMLSREIESRLLLAAAYAGNNQSTKAIKLLDSCFELAIPEGYLRVFLDIGKPLHELLNVYLQQKTSTHRAFAQQLLNSSTKGNISLLGLEQEFGLNENLTDREVEILNLISIGKTNREIAQELYISPGTVKAHTSNIYRKLDVENRTEAAARARDLDILS